MHSALWQLLWFDFRGSFRNLVNIRRSRQKLGLLALMLGLVGFLFVARSYSDDAELSHRFGPSMPFWALVYLAATWLTASADRGLVLRPAEIHFVAGGPFRSRDLISMNLFRLAFRALLSAAILSLVAATYVPNFLCSLVGMWMLIVVSLLVGMIASLSARRVYHSWIKFARRIVSFAAIGLLLGVVAQSLNAVREAGELPRVSAVTAAAHETPIGKVVLPPLEWMFRPMSQAAFWPDTVILLPPRLGVIGCLVLMIYVLGADYAEATTARTDQSIARRQSAMRSGIAQSTSWTRLLVLPRFGYWGGVGSIAWVQVLHSIRILPRFFLFTITIVGVVLVIPMLVEREQLVGVRAIVWMAGLSGYADFLLLLQLPVGFLGPLSQRETLKSLPVAAWRVVVGQLAGAVLPVALVHLMVTILFLSIVPQDRVIVLLTAVCLIPLAMVLIANVNLLGSWSIIKPRALQQRDALAAGRAMASVWIFFATLTPAALLAGAGAWALGSVLPSGLAFVLGEQSVVGSFVIGASCGLLLSTMLYIYLLARSFDRWQPTIADSRSEEKEFDR